MGFAMRMNFVDVVVSDSLKHYYVDGKKMGYQFDIRLSYYRGHFLSVIDEFKVKVDDSDKSPGWKFSEQEMKGIPVRIESSINVIRNSGG